MSQAVLNSGVPRGQLQPVRQVRRGGPASGVMAFAAVLIVMLLVVGVPLGYMAVKWTQAVTNAPGKIGEAFSGFAADAMRPKSTVNEIVLSTITDLHKESKLVVFTTVVNADVTREESASSGIMYWGTNVARITVKDARVQYVVDLSKMQTSDFQYDDNTKVMTLYIPRPKLDTQMVSIDPAKIQTLDLRGGWMRFDKQETRDNAVADLKSKVIVQAGAKFVKQLAADAGIDQTTKFLQPVAEAMAKEGAAVKVVYRD